MNAKRRSTRRQFLTGQSAVDALGDLTHGVGGSSGVASSVGQGRRTGFLMQLSRRAMACEFEVTLNEGENPDAADVALLALDLVDTLETQLTVYRDDSEVSLINARAACQEVRVETRLFGLLTDSVRLCEETGGAFDITSGPLSRLWGFARREGGVPAEEPLRETLDHVGSHHLLLANDSESVRFLKPGVEINLGGIGKGYSLDRCGELLRRDGIENYLLHGGQSSVLAGGTFRGQQAGPGWTVGLKHPLRPDRRLAEFRLADRALGTSGSATQFFHYQGRRLGHVLDPRTGWPAEGVLSATVLAPTAALADALSTAFYVLGVEQTRQFCKQHPELSAVLVTPSRGAGMIETHAIALSDEDWRVVSR